MDRVERGVAIDAEPEPEEPLVPTFGLDDWREVAEFLTVVMVVVVLAAATSVILVPA